MGDSRAVPVRGRWGPFTAIALLLATCGVAAGTTCSGSFSPKTQAEVDALAPCTTITGSLRIVATDIVELVGFASLQTALRIEIVSNTKLTAVRGFNNLTRVGPNWASPGDADPRSFCADALSSTSLAALRIESNTQLSVVSGFGNLTSVNGVLVVSQNALLTSLQGFASLGTVGCINVPGYAGPSGGVQLLSNARLANVDGFVALQTAGSISVASNNALTACDGFRRMRTVVDNISIVSNLVLTNVSAFNGIERCGGGVQLQSNSFLAQADMFAGFRSLGGLVVQDNGALRAINTPFRSDVALSQSVVISAQQLTELRLFDSLQVIGVDVELSLPSISNLSTFLSLRQASTFTLRGCSSLTSLSFLQSVTRFGGDGLQVRDCGLLDFGTSSRDLVSLQESTHIVFEGNAAMKTTPPLPSLSRLTGNFTCRDNPSLAAVGAAPQLTAVGGSFVLVGTRVAVAVDLRGLASLASVSADVVISGNPALISNPALLAFPGLETVGGVIDVSHNDFLDALPDFPSLSSAVQIHIVANARLTVVSGFPLLVRVGPDWSAPPAGATPSNFCSDALAASEFAALRIESNDVLTSVSGFASLLEVRGVLVVAGNPLLAQLQGFASVRTVGCVGVAGYSGPAGGCLVMSNAHLSNVEGFAALHTVGSLVLAQNALLSSCDGFGSLRTVVNDVAIVQNSVLVNISGLAGIDSCGGTFELRANALLEVADVFANFSTIGSVIIQDNNALRAINTPFRSDVALSQSVVISAQQLTELRLFDSLQVIGVDVELSLPSISNLSTFLSLRQASTFTLRGCSSLTSLSFLQSVTRFGGDGLQVRDCGLLDFGTSSRDLVSLQESTHIVFEGNAAMKTTPPLPSLSRLTGNFTCRDNPSLAAVGAAPQLTAVGGSLVLVGTKVRGAVDCRGFSKVTSVQRDVIFSAHAFVTFDATMTFDSLATVGGTLEVANCDRLDALPQFPALTSVLRVRILANARLTAIAGFGSVVRVGADFSAAVSSTFEMCADAVSNAHTVALRIEQNVQLTSVTGFQNLREVNGVMLVANNTLLVNMQGFSTVQSVGCAGAAGNTGPSGGLQVVGNAQLATLDGFASLVTTGHLVVSQNPSLKNLNGLRNVRTVMNDLVVLENTLLVNITAIASVTFVGGVVRITRNPVLCYDARAQVTLNFCGVTTIVFVENAPFPHCLEHIYKGPCHSSCATCSGPLATNCTACPFGSTFIPKNHTCVPWCVLAGLNKTCPEATRTVSVPPSTVTSTVTTTAVVSVTQPPVTKTLLLTSTTVVTVTPPPRTKTQTVTSTAVVTTTAPPVTKTKTETTTAVSTVTAPPVTLTTTTTVVGATTTVSIVVPAITITETAPCQPTTTSEFGPTETLTITGPASSLETPVPSTSEGLSTSEVPTSTQTALASPHPSRTAVYPPGPTQCKLKNDGFIFMAEFVIGIFVDFVTLRRENGEAVVCNCPLASAPLPQSTQLPPPNPSASLLPSATLESVAYTFTVNTSSDAGAGTAGPVTGIVSGPGGVESGDMTIATSLGAGSTFSFSGVIGMDVGIVTGLRVRATRATDPWICNSVAVTLRAITVLFDCPPGLVVGTEYANLTLAF